MGILVAPPPVSPRLFGLFSVVGVFREGERFQQGVEWEQRPLDTSGIVAFDDLCKQVSNEPGVGRHLQAAIPKAPRCCLPFRQHFFAWGC